VANFAAMPHYDYQIGLPSAGSWTEVINTDADVYGGSGVGNMGVLTATKKEWHGRPASAAITIPPMAVLWLAPSPRQGS
jgi:1,4-alpha-glucan branching enzyme